MPITYYPTFKNSSGNLGLGTISPAYRLDVKAATSNSTTILAIRNSGDSYNFIVNDSGTASAGADFRAPIFYDSNNTNFYLDPASTSVINALSVTVINDLNAASNVWHTSSEGKNRFYFANNGTTYYSTGNNYVFRNNSDSGVVTIDSSGNLRTTTGGDNYASYSLHVGGTGFASADFRTPIFYDSDDTAYYLNPASTSNINALTVAGGSATIYRDLIVNGGASGNFGNRIIVQGTATTYTLQDSNARPTVYLTGQYPVVTLNHTVTNNTNHGPTIQFTFNGLTTGGSTSRQVVIGPDGTGSRLDFGFSGGGYGTNSDYNPHNGIAGYSGITAMRLFSNGLLVGNTGAYPNQITSTSYALDVRGTGYSNTDFRAPIFYDSDDTGYYLNPASTSRLNTINVGASGVIINNGATAPERNLKIKASGSGTSSVGIVLYDSSDTFRCQLYSEPSNYGFLDGLWAGWDLRKTIDGNLYLNDSTTYYLNTTSTSALYDLTLIGSKNTYLYINPGNGYEAMVRYNGGSGNTWYVGKRVTSQLVGTESFHFYSEAAGATVGGIDTSGNTFSTGSFRAPIFYDSNNTAYYIDAASTSNLNVLVVAASARVGGASSRSTSGLTVGFTDNSTFAANTDVGDSDRMLSIVNESTTTNAMSVLGFRVNPNGGTANAMMDVKFVQTGVTNTSALHYTFNHGGTFADRFSILSSGNVGIGAIAPDTNLQVNGHIHVGNQTTFDNTGGWNKTIYLDGTVHARMRIIGSAFASGKNSQTETNIWVDNSVSPYSGLTTNAGSFTINAGFTTLTNSARSPIFYDSDDTAYYINPASVSNIRHTIFDIGSNLVGATGVGVLFDGNYTTGQYRHRFRKYDDGSGLPLYIDYAHGTANSFTTIARFGGGGTYNSFSVYGTADASGDFRAPIFYDSNNTGYYIDAASNSRVSQITTDTGTAIYLGNQNVSTSSRTIINWHSDADYNYLIGKRAGAWTQPMDIAFYTGIRYHAHQFYNAHIFYVTGYDSGEAFSIGKGDAHVRVVNNLYVPIIYDTNDTGYYIDPASTSNLGTVYAIESYARNWFRNVDSGEGLYNESSTQHFYSDSVNYWNIASSASAQGLRFRTGGYNGAIRGYIYADTSNSIGFLDQSGNWKLRVVNGDYSLADGSSMRAQIFYDTNDTSYYCDPASTSSFATLSLAGTLQFGGNINWNHGVTTELGRKTIGFNIWQGGKKLNADEDFNSGTNNITVYNNNGGSALTITRTAVATAPNSSGQVLRVAYTPGSSGTSPGFGGFYFATQTAANKVFVTRFVANIPSGRSLSFHSNAYGTNSNAYWLTNNAGTGKWEEYVFVVMCGNTGTFSSTNFFAITGGADTAFSWDIASATVFDITNKYEIVNRTITGDLSVNSPIFYDSQNTSYYIDAASTSNLVGLTVANTITGSISGNAGTATTLQTARNINGTSFNGSANITTATWGTSRSITIGATIKSVDGSANVAWTLAEITGSQAANVFLASPNGSTGNPTFRSIVAADIPTLNQNTTGSSGSCTGNSATATNLSTNRTNWSTNGTISAVVGQLAWKHYGNNHTIIDASNSTAPDGTAINNTNPGTAWSGTYPTLMGWNGSSTYGVRVDSSRYADQVGYSPNRTDSTTYPILWGAGSTYTVAYSCASTYIQSSTGTIYANAFYDAGNTTYYLDPASSSFLYTVRANNFYANQVSVTASASTTINTLYNVTELTLSASITTLTFSSIQSSTITTMWTVVTVGNGTTYSITWPAAVKWPGGTAPTITSTNGKKDIYQFVTYDGGTNIYAIIVGQNL